AFPDIHSFPTRRSSDLGKNCLTVKLLIANCYTSSLPFSTDFLCAHNGGCHAKHSCQLSLQVYNYGFVRDGETLLATVPVSILLRSEEHTSELQSRENLV